MRSCIQPGEVIGCLTVEAKDGRKWICTCSCGRKYELRNTTLVQYRQDPPECKHALQEPRASERLCQRCYGMTHRREYPKCPVCRMAWAPEVLPGAVASGLGEMEVANG